MNHIIFVFLLLTIVSCNNSTIEPKPSLSDITELEKSAPEIDVLSQEQSEPVKTKEENSENTSTYQGAFFKVEFPNSFQASPNSPVTAENNIETDEATFTSPDGTVQFFVYSPQWGGEPKEYLTVQENEMEVSQSMNIDKKKQGVITTRFQTVKDKDDKYTRSIMSQKSESTHLVFGIKYANQDAYNQYKTAYIAFKKSLEQYGD